MSSKLMSLLVAVAFFGVACSSSNELNQVTPLPNQTATQMADDTTSLPEKDELTATPELSVVQLQATSATILNLTQDANTITDRQTGVGNFALATFTPSPNLYEPGEARAIAIATDIVMQPDIDEPLTFEQAIVPIRFDEMYDGFSIRTGLQFSDKLKSLDGQRVIMQGYVAPPLKPRLDFFVLTKIQLAFCPFCSTDVEWPDDIALVYMPEEATISSEYPVEIIGILEVGSNIDPETGMVSLVRIYLEELNVLN